MSTIRNLLGWAQERIPAADARLLLADALGLPLSHLLLATEPTPVQIDRFAEHVAARLCRSACPCL